MANGFKTPAGALAITGLMGLPLWLWSCRSANNTNCVCDTNTVVHVNTVILWILAGFVFQIYVREFICIASFGMHSSHWTLDVCQCGGMGAVRTHQRPATTG